VAQLNEPGAMALSGAALVLVGLSFKVAVVPFHMWTPDVYEGAPTTVTAFMSVGAKVAGFAAMMRIFIFALPEMSAIYAPSLAVISALTLILGNVVALVQKNVKRMLAYSSIAHAGYILIGVAAGGAQGVSSALYYMLAYLFTNLGAFAVVVAVERREGQGVELDDYKGLARRNLPLALALAYFMLSLTGIPPSGGFVGKFFVFGAALQADLAWLAIVGVVTSVVSAYFYLRLVYLSFMFDSEREEAVVAQPALNVALGITVLATLILGLAPAPWMEMAREAVVAGGQILAGG
jgi:NADH-quinone oxidoreductase subunit N